MPQHYGGIRIVVVMVLFRVSWFLSREKDRCARRQKDLPSFRARWQTCAFPSTSICGRPIAMIVGR